MHASQPLSQLYRHATKWIQVIMICYCLFPPQIVDAHPQVWSTAVKISPKYLNHTLHDQVLMMSTFNYLLTFHN